MFCGEDRAVLSGGEIMDEQTTGFCSNLELYTSGSRVLTESREFAFLNSWDQKVDLLLKFNLSAAARHSAMKATVISPVFDC